MDIGALLPELLLLFFRGISAERELPLLLVLLLSGSNITEDVDDNGLPLTWVEDNEDDVKLDPFLAAYAVCSVFHCSHDQVTSNEKS